MRRYFLGVLVSCGLTLGSLGCVAPQQGGEAAATARTIAQAASEVSRTVEAAFADIVRRRGTSGVALDAPMTVNEWVFIGLQVAAVVASYAPQ